MTWYAFLGALEQGFVYGIMVLGVYLTFRVLDFPDLTVDGSLPLGASVSAVAITHGMRKTELVALHKVDSFFPLPAPAQSRQPDHLYAGSSLLSRTVELREE